jgi:hypothetical protein
MMDDHTVNMSYEDETPPVRAAATFFRRWMSLCVLGVNLSLGSYALWMYWLFGWRGADNPYLRSSHPMHWVAIVFGCAYLTALSLGAVCLVVCLFYGRWWQRVIAIFPGVPVCIILLWTIMGW